MPNIIRYFKFLCQVTNVMSLKMSPELVAVTTIADGRPNLQLDYRCPFFDNPLKDLEGRAQTSVGINIQS